MRSNELLEEIDFLKAQGENRHRIVEVIEASGVKLASFRTHLYRKGRNDVIDFLFSKESERVIPEHGNAARYNMGCRCQLCRLANTERHAAFRRSKAEEVKDPNDPRHGTYPFYTNHGCRCPRCKAAHKEKCDSEYQRRLATPIRPDDHRHGTYSFYTAYGCRCDRCKGASKDYRQKRNAA